MKKLSTKQINNFTKEELDQFIISYGDGQGDTFLKTLKELHKDYSYDKPTPYITSIDNVYADYGGNMVNIAWIENNKMLKIKFLD